MQVEIRTCPGCGGTYQKPASPNPPYFHVCPPVTNPDYQPDPSKADYDPREWVEREGHVDENLPLLTTEHEIVFVKRGGMHVPDDPSPPPARTGTPPPAPPPRMIETSRKRRPAGGGGRARG